MKIAATLAAIALIGCGSAFAADAPAGTAAAKAPAAASATTPAAGSATPAPSAAPAKHASLKACNKQADGKKLTGSDRTKFVKDCHSGKSAS
ncbi:MAG TPA: PsiF family protein [Steroidobacteraceae bacterium]|jgi:hypothetical protein